jgi:hypothetical protein
MRNQTPAAQNVHPQTARPALPDNPLATHTASGARRPAKVRALSIPKSDSQPIGRLVLIDRLVIDVIDGYEEEWDENCHADPGPVGY